MNKSYNLHDLSNKFINSHNYFKINSNIIEHMDGENQYGFIPPNAQIQMIVQIKEIYLLLHQINYHVVTGGAMVILIILIV